MFLLATTAATMEVASTYCVHLPSLCVSTCIVNVFARVLFKEVMKTKYKLGSFERLFCLDNNDINFIVNLKQIIEILKATCSAVTTPRPFYDSSCTSSQNVVYTND